jgi:threonyl-tRNA synthetase
VVGDDDLANGTVGVNPRGGDVERGVPVDEFLARVIAEVAERGLGEAGKAVVA